jgi:hypothetical protein
MARFHDETAKTKRISRVVLLAILALQKKDKMEISTRDTVESTKQHKRQKLNSRPAKVEEAKGSRNDCFEILDVQPWMKPWRPDRAKRWEKDAPLKVQSLEQGRPLRGGDFILDSRGTTVTFEFLL